MIFAKFNQPSNATKFWWRALPQKGSAHFHDMPSLYGVISPMLFFVHIPITAIIIGFELYATLLMHDNGIPLGIIITILAIEFVIAFGISCLSSIIRGYDNSIWYREKWVSDGKNWKDWIRNVEIDEYKEDSSEKINKINRLNLEIQGFGRKRRRSKLVQFVLFIILCGFFYYKVDNYISHFGFDFSDLDFRLIFTGYIVGLVGHSMSTGKVLSCLLGVIWNTLDSNDNALKNAVSDDHWIAIIPTISLKEDKDEKHQIVKRNNVYYLHSTGFINDVEGDKLIFAQEGTGKMIVATFVRDFQID